MMSERGAKVQKYKIEKKKNYNVIYAQSLWSCLAFYDFNYCQQLKKNGW